MPKKRVPHRKLRSTESRNQQNSRPAVDSIHAKISTKRKPRPQPTAALTQKGKGGARTWLSVKWEIWRNSVVEVFFGAVVIGGAFFIIGRHFGRIEHRQSEILENVRFIRSTSSSDHTAARPFEGFDLSNQKLNGLDLYGASFDLTTLHETQMNRSVLTGSSFSGAKSSTGLQITRSDLVRANFSSAKIENSDFTYSDLSSADFSFANLTGSKLLKANLTLTNFYRANLTRVTFGNSALGAPYFQNTYFFKTNISGADFRQADLRFATFVLRKDSSDLVCWDSGNPPYWPADLDVDERPKQSECSSR
jgi:uncharacterized protein YjbI with pentapeptide repeats